VDEQDQLGHVLEQVEIDMAEEASEWVVGICQSSLTSAESMGRDCP
jgi:Asp/Glu/hydantoin racemase